MQTPYRTVNIVSASEDLIINKVIVNRDQCTESIGIPKAGSEDPLWFNYYV